LNNSYHSKYFNSRNVKEIVDKIEKKKKNFKYVFLIFLITSLVVVFLDSASAEEFRFRIPSGLTLSMVTDVVVDSSGNIFALSANGNVKKISPDGTVLLEFGSFGSGDGQFWAPQGIAVDGVGNIYVVDTGNDRVQIFDSAGVFQSKFGSVCNMHYTVDCVDPDGGGPLELGDGQFSNPHGVAVDSSGNVYVADYFNSRIQKFDSAGVFQSKFGSGGSNNGQFSGAEGIAVDNSGNIYVTDSGNNRIQIFGASCIVPVSGFPVIVNCDSDGDGIADSIDPFPNDDTNNTFDDGITSGSIVRGDQILTITDEPNPAGVRIVSNPASGPTPATIGCGGTVITITPGDDLTITCSSSIVEVIVGPVEAVFTGSSGAVGTVSLNDGDKITFEPETFTFTNNGRIAFEIFVDGNPIQIASGQSVPVLQPDLKVPIKISPKQIIVPSWIKTNAGWWAGGQIKDDSFVEGIKYLIKEDIMKIPQTRAGTGTSQVIPSWIKTNADWWAKGQISDESFVNGIQWLIENGVMKIG